ncbi:MAG: OmpA family protein [Spirochaetota bacterium]
MKRERCLILLAAAVYFFAAVSPVSAYYLKWDLKKGERLEIVKTASVTVYLNSMAAKKYEERNIIDLSCYEREGDIQKLKGGFSVFSRDQGSDPFHLDRRELSDFSINPDGKYIVPEQYVLPNLRSIPSFPAKDLALKESWTAPAELILDHLSRPFLIPFTVTYRLDEVKKEKGRTVALISYSYTIDKNLHGMKIPGDYPLMIAAKNKGYIYWDIDAGRPLDGSDQYAIIFMQNDDVTTIQFKMNIDSGHKVYAAVLPDQREKEKKEIENDLAGKKGISVDTDPRGLVLRMGEVLFDLDSASLRDDTRTTLDAVVDVLKKRYPDREILVEGHTDSTGEKAYNQALSDKRARSVAQYLQKGVGHDKLSFRGFGADKPAADNAKPEGRAKNRRVEIIIKLN